MAAIAEAGGSIALEGGRKARRNLTKARIRWVIAVLVLIFGAVVLHKIPEGFTISSIMLASGRSRRTAIYASAILAVSTILGAVLISFFSQSVRYALPFSAGVTFYIAASDLVPIINESRGLSLSFTFFAGIVVFYFSDLILARYLF